MRDMLDTVHELVEVVLLNGRFKLKLASSVSVLLATTCIQTYVQQCFYALCTPAEVSADIVHT